MQVRFLIGPAGSGKTFCCLAEARQALLAAPEGLPLVLLAPKQGTYQLEQQLLSDSSLAGYTRLRILPFESLARDVLDSLQKPLPRMLDEEGRLMVLRNLLVSQRDKLKLFRASARLTGFAQQLSLVLHELQSNCLTPAAVNELADRVQHAGGLAYKLQDLATLLTAYLDWLKTHNLHDADCLLAAAAEALRDKRKIQGPTTQLTGTGAFGTSSESSPAPLRLAQLWVDGFAEFSEQEVNLLAALLPDCRQATLTFCIAQASESKTSWLSPWSVVRKTYDQCQKRIAGLPGVEILVEELPREPNATRFCTNPVLGHLEKHWAEPMPFASSAESQLEIEQIKKNFRMVACLNPEAEASFAAREILKFVRAGARFRDISVLVRTLEGYHQPLQRVFSRYGIPFFLDRRESIAHHPLAELTRSALRTVALGWQHDDWFAALKSGLVAADERRIDRLENEALARGWRGAVWRQPLRLRDDTATVEALEKLQRLEREMEALREEIIWPFEKLALAVAISGNKVTGPLLAAAIRDLWEDLNAQARLETWAEGEPSNYESLARGSIHQTVWKQCQAWLDNLELAFPIEALPLREWLPILEAGLGSLNVGSIPPALDQVLIGAIDRSRTPDIKLALILGMNESVFPAPARASLLLTDSDRVELEKCNVNLGSTARRQLGSERYLAYIACTRPRERVVFSCALNAPDGTPLNPSPFLSQVAQLFPGLELEKIATGSDWHDCQHVHELISPLLKSFNLENNASVSSIQHPASSIQHPVSSIHLPELSALMQQLSQYRNPQFEESLAPELAEQLYGPVLRTSVSRMEQFAACPFKFFVHSGLRADERKLFELDAKEQGTFQHDVLALFHQQLQAEQKRWRDITPQVARERVAKIARNLLASFRDGLLEATDETRFTAGVLTESLQDFVETLVGWMGNQYLFDPVKVELPFGADDNSPPWLIELGDSQSLEIYGRIDRVDLYRAADSEEALCVVVDYKSSQKELDPVLMAHGLQLQLLTYLNVLRRWPNPHALFGVNHLAPAGVFYVNLRGRYPRESNRVDALCQTDLARKSAYRHAGRFDTRALPQLDARPDAHQGDQFNYRLTQAGEIHGGCREALDSAEFKALLDHVEASLRKMGLEIYSGAAAVSPYRKGTVTACDRCDYRSICRIDPWAHRFRVLKREKVHRAN